jgi:protein-L-isoaspartate O-methyltransferase
MRDKGLITTDRVYDTMVRVDRKNFVPEEMYHNAYSDMPRPIGWNTTISAPHMHSMTLEKL